MVQSLEWITVVDVVGAEHYIAASGWLLARIQRGPSSKGWLWSVGTHREVLGRGRFEYTSELADAKTACDAVVTAAYMRGASD